MWRSSLCVRHRRGVGRHRSKGRATALGEAPIRRWCRWELRRGAGSATVPRLCDCGLIQHSMLSLLTPWFQEEPEPVLGIIVGRQKDAEAEPPLNLQGREDGVERPQGNLLDGDSELLASRRDICPSLVAALLSGSQIPHE